MKLVLHAVFVCITHEELHDISIISMTNSKLKGPRALNMQSASFSSSPFHQRCYSLIAKGAHPAGRMKLSFIPELLLKRKC